MKKDTKTKIIEIAIQRFNKEGFGNVSMNEIALELGLSRGNLAYHFKDKELLLEAIVGQMWEAFRVKREETLSFPSFKNITEEFHLLYKVQKKYAFIFLDSNVLRKKKIKTEIKKMVERSIQDNKTVLAFAIKMGNIKPEIIPGTYDRLAFLCWMVSSFWLGQQTMRINFKEESAEKTLWTLIYPHLTDKGKQALEAFLGVELIHYLGEPFEHNLDNLMPI